MRSTPGPADARDPHGFPNELGWAGWGRAGHVPGPRLVIGHDPRPLSVLPDAVAALALMRGMPVRAEPVRGSWPEEDPPDQQADDGEGDGHQDDDLPLFHRKS